MNTFLSQDFWQQRYEEGTTGWDMGGVSPPLKAFFDSLDNKDLRILIPGCGNAWEARYLVDQGFTDITVIDIAEAPVANLKAAIGEEGSKRCKVIQGDFFTHSGAYDLIVEQTFFCAIDPSLRIAYAEHMATLLAPGGMLAGVLFRTPFDKPGPPFGGTEEEYRQVFGKLFDIEIMELCRNSHPAREGNELFIRLRSRR